MHKCKWSILFILVIVFFTCKSSDSQEVDIERVALTDAEKDEMIHFRNSIHSRNRAIDLLSEGTTGGIIKDVDEKKLEESLSSLREALKESQNVSDSILSKLHPDFPAHYRNEFCKGIKLFIQGIEVNKPLTNLKGQMLMDKFGDWYEAHLNEIKARHH